MIIDIIIVEFIVDLTISNQLNIILDIVIEMFICASLGLEDKIVVRC